MPNIKRIHHVAILVEDIEASVKFWRDGLGLSLSKMQDNPAEQAKIAFLPVGEGEIELVQPTSTDSGLTRALEKRGQGMHHLCLEVDHLVELVEDLKTKGIELINEAPRFGSDGRKYVFIHPKSTARVLVELYELIA